MSGPIATGASTLMQGRRGLVMGVANERSLAWGIARTLRAHTGTVPQDACARTSAASKSSIPCTRCASLNQAVSGLLRSMGVNKLMLAP